MHQVLLLSFVFYSFFSGVFINSLEVLNRQIAIRFSRWRNHNTACIKKTEQIWNRSQRREAAQSMKFLINIDCLGTYDVE